MTAPAEPKQIVKEGLSEYFLYTIEGTETIPNGWSKRLLSFDVDDVPVVNLYKFEEERYGSERRAVPELQERQGAQARRHAHPGRHAQGLPAGGRPGASVLRGPVVVQVYPRG